MKTIVDIKVVDVEKRRTPSKHYVYKIFLTWSEGSTTVVYRRYSKFFEFQVGLLEAFPEEGGSKDPSKRMIPFLPGKKIFGRSHIREVAMKRLDRIDEYCRTLVRLPPNISECRELIEFFTVTPEDINPPTEEETKKKKKKSKETQGECITEPMLLEQYVAIADYKKQKKNEVDLKEGAIADVVEKNENGWWFVNVDFEQGWVPASYLEPVDGSPEPEGDRVAPGEEETFISTSAYTAEKDDEMSFEQGVTVEVVQKNLDGWWLIRYQKKEGWAPAAFLVKPRVLVDSSAVTGPVEIVGSAMEAASASVTTLSSTPAKEKPRKASGSRSPGSVSPSIPKKNAGEPKPVLPMAVKSPQQQQRIVPTPRRGSIKISRPKKTPGKTNLHNIAEAVQRARDGTPMDKIFVSTAAFQSPESGGLSFDAGVKVEVIEEADTGWWFVRLVRGGGGGEGWVPSTYFEPAQSPPTPRKTSTEETKAKPAAAPPPPPKRAPRKKKTKKVTTFVTMAAFESQMGDGISFAGGQTVIVEEKAANGWWYVRIGDDEGWAPSSYIETKEEEVEVSDDEGGDVKEKSKPAPLPVTRKSVGNELDLRKTSDEKKPMPTARKSLGTETEADSNPLAAALAVRMAKMAKQEKGGGGGGGTGAPSPPRPKREAIKPTKTEKAVINPAVPKRTPVSLPDKDEKSVAVKSTAKSPPRPKRGPMKLPEKKTTAGDTSTNKPSPRVPRRATAAPATATAEPIANKLASVLSAGPPKPAKRNPPLPAQVPRSKTTTAVDRKSGEVSVSVYAVGDYVGEKGEASFKANDEGGLLEKNENGWWYVRFGSSEGWAPSTYLKEGKKSSGGKSPPVRPSYSPATKRKDAQAKILPSPVKRSKPPVSKEAGGGYVTTGDYAVAADGEIGFTAGQSVEVVEKNDSGWWFIKIGTKEGWAPSTYLELSKKADSAKPERPVRVPVSNGAPSTGSGYRTVAAYSDNGFSFEGGQFVTVEEKSESGWWYVKIGNKEGWAPSTYIEPV